MATRGGLQIQTIRYAAEIQSLHNVTMRYKISNSHCEATRPQTAVKQLSELVIRSHRVVHGREGGGYKFKQSARCFMDSRVTKYGTMLRSIVCECEMMVVRKDQ